MGPWDTLSRSIYLNKGSSGKVVESQKAVNILLVNLFFMIEEMKMGILVQTAHLS
jgi:hypothetical protein